MFDALVGVVDVIGRVWVVVLECGVGVVVGAFGGERLPAAQVGRGRSFCELHESKAAEVEGESGVSSLVGGVGGFKEAVEGDSGVVVPRLGDVCGDEV